MTAPEWIVLVVWVLLLAPFAALLVDALIDEMVARIREDLALARSSRRKWGST